MLQKTTAIIILLFIPFSLSAEITFWSDLDDEVLADTLINLMTDEELLGQVLLLGYMSKTPSPEILDWISRRKIGGIKIFGWNVSDLKTLGEAVGQMQSKAQENRLRIPLFIATDQEGGWVRHVKVTTSITPGNLAIGAAGLFSDAYKTGYYIGLELKELGINMNFAPTVDVYTNPEAHVIGPRAFSSDPVKTALYALAYYQGMNSTSIICTAKHFPGHGNADQDSHGTLPLISSSFDELWDRDIVPYRILIREGLPAIMSGHLGFPEIVDNDTPASLSEYFLTEVLRRKLDYNGLVITDDMIMSGVLQKGLSMPEICRKALSAGNDIIMISRYPDTHEKIRDFLYPLLQTDPDFRKTIIESVKRILLTKMRYLKGEDPVPLQPDIERIRENIPNPEGQEFFFEQACRSITVIEQGKIPIENNDKTLLAGYYNNFFDIGKIYFPDADKIFLPESSFYTSGSTNAERILSMADNYDTIIFSLSNPGNLKVLKKLEKLKTKLIIFSIHTPVYFQELPWVETAIAVYGTGIDSFQAGFAALTGDIIAAGTLPIDIKGKE